METTETGVNLKTEALKNGAIWGAISIVIFLVTWYMMPSLMSSYAYSGILMLVGIALAVFFCIDMRKKAGGFWSFGEALWNIFAMFLLSMAIMYVFNIIFGKYIDPTYPTTMKELVMAKTEGTLKSIGMAEADMSQALEKTSENLDKQFTPTFSQAIVGFGIAAVVYFIGALIFAAIFKRNRPVFLGSTEE
ncbi:DUF4199 domain-containing protein [Pedobacter boryungensis]|uniref:DUF4199 domain-containing protein n=1 Tax=Pedobacter boryungensis TaxID=869962 RepID=A0ABX2DA91_9SPHI|nr:DUF4199 domain-containing protein [Pedobacter boryungensis]NQX30338.1 DUF4199 domain-containing protein [Pedobacter boryungensis]